ncbi:YcbK family protein [Pseudobacteriovorax antillogorgiicola]|uniref:YcbK family protein n=1 Tax=Pseudobacteriovorax antillogorgiicola TaxID=1513793 RepID=UPI00228563A2|nr:D-Ala-D-Ala carboxypeptidase family metallohydrolase [Pseudobacteriovorax antillogorgiicola]
MEEKRENLTDNFKLEEISCPCGNCEARIDNRYLFKMQALRDIIGKPFKINSWFRCLAYNRTLAGSSQKSQHILGKATDISTRGWSDNEIMSLISKAYLLGFKGIGIYPTFVHLDSREGEFGMWCVGS